MHEQIKEVEKILEIKNKKKEVDRIITFGSLLPTEKFTNAINVRKQFMDNIKMIAYKAETAM